MVGGATYDEWSYTWWVWLHLVGGACYTNVLWKHIGKFFGLLLGLREVTLEYIVYFQFTFAGSDYESISQTLTFTPGSGVGEVRLSLLDDSENEGLEEFSVAIVLVDGMLGRPGIVGEALVQILDDESKSNNVSF